MSVVLVTGGASGIGAACARIFAERDWSVIIADRDADLADELAADIRRRAGRAVSAAVDVLDTSTLDAAVDLARTTFGQLDAAINSAGIGAAPAPMAELTEQAWNDVLAVNLTGVFNSMRAEIPALLEHGGAIVNVSSILGSGAQQGSAAYTASKHGVEGLTKVAALDYSDRGVRVNSIAPGFIDTELLQARRTPDERRDIAARHPANRLGSPAEVAEVAYFLCSPAAAFVSGSCYRVDGGYLTPGGWA